MVVRMYLEDLDDAELLIRPADSMNHLAWQLGHLIQSENFHVNEIFPNCMPSLPSGFRERHTQATAASDNPSDFLTKSEYLAAMETQRAGTLAVLAKLSDAELMSPSPDSIAYLGPTIGCIFAGESSHWMMHAGQWAVVRRKLGRKPLF